MKDPARINLLAADSCFSEGKKRAVLVSLSVPGYYSIPVRLLALIAHRDAEASAKWDVRYAEWDNHEDINKCCDLLLEAKPALIAFSVNIWNLLAVQTLSKAVKKIDPDIKILCGGQEVTNSFVDYLQTTSSWDYIIDGEGETAFLQFLKSWDSTLGDIAAVESVSGLRYRDARTGCTRLTRSADIIHDISQLPSILQADMVPALMRNRLGVMIEGTRGCNCKCTFCFEGYCDRKVRFSEVSTIEADVRFMLRKGSRLFHLLDPIIAGHDTERTKYIMGLFDKFFKENRDLRLSVEAYAERLGPEDFAALGRPYITIDLGLQSLNPETLKAIRRPFSRERFIQGVEGLHRTPARTNIYLICGLPFETPATYLRGVREAAGFNPNQLFLNELVMLNGTELRKQADTNDWGYVYNDLPPYDVGETRWIPAKTFLALKSFSNAFSSWYNCRRSLSLLFGSWKENGGRSSGIPCRTELVQGILRLGGGEILSNENRVIIAGSKVLLRIEDTGLKEINAALTRLYLWGCSRVTLELSQTGLRPEIADSDIRLLRVDVTSPQSVVDDLRAFTGQNAPSKQGQCVELVWPKGRTLPVKPEFYRKLAALPMTIMISVQAATDAGSLRCSIDAAHKSKIWIRLPADADWFRQAMEHIWGAECLDVQNELKQLDRMLDSAGEPEC